MRISVIIPTWNEETWLPRLLAKLEQIGGIYEIIVADNNSSDSTISIAEENGTIIVRGGKPAEARNRGAKAAEGDVLLFIDADAIISRQVINAVASNLEDPEVVAVHFKTVPLTRQIFVRFCYSVFNIYLALIDSVGLSQGVSSCLAIRRKTFMAIKGFDESVGAVEDIDIFNRLRRKGRVVFENNVEVHVSARRFFAENRIGFLLKCILWGLLRILGLKASIIPYTWFSYPSHYIDHETELLADMEKHSKCIGQQHGEHKM